MSSRFQFKVMDATTVTASRRPLSGVAYSALLSSDTEGDPSMINDRKRKRKRMISNRESARRSRMRKQHHLDHLLHAIINLQTENMQILSRIDVTEQHYRMIEAENVVLRAQVSELIDGLQYLNSVLHFVEDFSGIDVDTPEISDPLLKPWRLPDLGQAIFPSADFQCLNIQL